MNCTKLLLLFGDEWTSLMCANYSTMHDVLAGVLQGFLSYAGAQCARFDWQQTTQVAADNWHTASGESRLVTAHHFYTYDSHKRMHKLSSESHLAQWNTQLARNIPFTPYVLAFYDISAT